MVRYHNAGTQRFKDTEHESVDTDDLTVESRFGHGATAELIHDPLETDGGGSVTASIPAGEYDLIWYEGQMGNSSGSGSDNNAKVRLNGYNTDEYDYTQRRKGSLTEVTGDDGFEFGTISPAHASFTRLEFWHGAVLSSANDAGTRFNALGGHKIPVDGRLSPSLSEDEDIYQVEVENISQRPINNLTVKGVILP